MVDYPANLDEAATVAPRISVMIPVFNRRHLVTDSVASALAQDTRDMEIIVIDNCSTDGTWEALQSFSDPRLRLLRNSSNIGLFGNFNRCGAEARGEYVLFLCSDDRLSLGFLSAAVTMMETNPSVVLLSSRAKVIDEQGALLYNTADHFPPGHYIGSSVPPAWFWAHYHYGTNPLNYPSGVLFRGKALRECLPFRAEFGAPADIELFFRVLRLGDLIVTSTIGCSVISHTGQEGDGLRKSGELVKQQLALLDAFRPELEQAQAYGMLHRQIACLMMGALIRAGRSNRSRSMELFRSFGRSPGQMLYASVRRTVLKAMRRLFGFRALPYLKRAQHV